MLDMDLLETEVGFDKEDGSTGLDKVVDTLLDWMEKKRHHQGWLETFPQEWVKKELDPNI